METPASPLGPQSIVRHQPLVARVMGILLVATTLVLVVASIILATTGEMTGFLVLLGLGVLCAGLSVLCLRPRVVLDATGIHVRDVIRSHDLPWPTSRGVLVANEQQARGSIQVAVAQYRPADGSRPVRILPLRATASGIGNAAAALDQKLDQLWAWAVARGYASPAPHGAPAAPTAAGYGVVPGAPPTPGSPVLGAPVPGAAHGVGSPMPVPGGPTPSPHPVGGDGPLIDPRLLDQPRLEFRGSRMPLLFCVPLTLFFGACAVIMLVTKEEEGGNPLYIVGMFLLTAFIAVLTVDTALARTVVDREGIHLKGIWPQTVPWPASRHQLVAVFEYRGRSTAARGHVVSDDGKNHQMALIGRQGDLPPELDVVRSLDTIWAWGQRWCGVRENGQYVPATNASFERQRRATLERIAYLRSGR